MSELFPGEREIAGLCQEWAMDGDDARRRKRVQSTLAQLQGFYDAMLPHLDAALVWLSDPERDGDETCKRYFDLCLMLAEVAPAIENFKSPRVPNGLPIERFTRLSAYPGARLWWE